MYQVLQVYTSFNFCDNFLSRSIKVGQSWSRRRRLRVAKTSPRRCGDVAETSSQLFLNHLVSSRSQRRLGDVAETSSSLKTYLVAATSPRPTGDLKKSQKSRRKNRTCWIHRDSLATRETSRRRRGDVSATHGDSSRQQVAN